MEGQAVYITSKGDPIIIKDVNNPPAGVPPELCNFLKNITLCDIFFDKDKYDKEKKAADDKYDRDVAAAEKTVKASKEYKALETEVAKKTADIATQKANIANLDAQYTNANKKHDKNYVDTMGTYNNAIQGDNNVIAADRAKMTAMINAAKNGVKKEEVNIEFTCKNSKACVKASKCPLRNLKMRKGTQKINGAYKDTTTIKKTNADNKKLDNDSLYFCPCDDADEEGTFEIVGGVAKKLEEQQQQQEKEKEKGK